MGQASASGVIGKARPIADAKQPAIAQYHPRPVCTAQAVPVKTSFVALPAEREARGRRHGRRVALDRQTDETQGVTRGRERQGGRGAPHRVPGGLPIAAAQAHDHLGEGDPLSGLQRHRPTGRATGEAQPRRPINGTLDIESPEGKGGRADDEGAGGLIAMDDEHGQAPVALAKHRCGQPELAAEADGPALPLVTGVGVVDREGLHPLGGVALELVPPGAVRVVEAVGGAVAGTVHILDQRVPMGRVTADIAATVEDEPQVVTLGQLQVEARLNASGIIGPKLGHVELLGAQTDSGADPVAAVGVGLGDASRYGDSAVPRRDEGATTGDRFPRVLPVSAHARPIRAAPEGRSVPLLRTVRQGLVDKAPLRIDSARRHSEVDGMEVAQGDGLAAVVADPTGNVDQLHIAGGVGLRGEIHRHGRSRALDAVARIRLQPEGRGGGMARQQIDWPQQSNQGKTQLHYR